MAVGGLERKQSSQRVCIFYNSVINAFNSNAGTRTRAYLFAIKCFESINFMCIALTTKTPGKLFLHIISTKKNSRTSSCFRKFHDLSAAPLGIMPPKWNKGVMFAAGQSRKKASRQWEKLIQNNNNGTNPSPTRPSRRTKLRRQGPSFIVFYCYLSTAWSSKRESHSYEHYWLWVKTSAVWNDAVISWFCLRC